MSSLSSFYLFFSLPEEMSFHIVSFLSAEDMCVLARTSKDLKRFTTENMLWRKLCKRNGWVVTRNAMQESKESFDFKKYFSEKTMMTKPGSLQWADCKPTGAMPSKRFKHSATVVGNQIVYIGGQETDTKRFNEIVIYDTTNNTFTQPTIKGDKVPNFSRHTATLVSSKMFIFGGFDGHGQNFDLSTFEPFNKIWTNVSRNAQKGTPPPSRTNHAAAAVGKKLYIFGGNNNSEAGQYQVLDDLHVLDTLTMTWSRPPTTGEAPTARSGHTLTTIGKKLYLFGGGVWNEREGWVHKFNDLYILDTVAMHWTKAETKGNIDSSTFPISFAVGRFLFVFGGGSKPAHCVTNDLYVLDTVTMIWDAPECPGTKPAARDMGTASSVGDAVYFLGGYAGGAMEFFDKMVVTCGPAIISSGAACN